MESGTLTTLDGGFLISEADVSDSDRPLEGDAIYHPILKKLFEINFVDHDDPFNQLDNNPVYKMRCRLYEYSSEALDTGISAIDAIEDALSTDTLGYQISLEQTTVQNEPFRLELFADNGLIADEDGDNIIGEDDSTSVGESILMEHNIDTGHGGWLISEDYIIGTGGVNTNSVDKSAQNELFDELDDTILDFSEKNPFSDAGSS